MDVTSKPASTRQHLHHHQPLQDPVNAPPSTIQTISTRFSKLYANHKKLNGNSMEPSLGGHSHPHPQPETRFQAKTDSFPSFSDTLSATLTKSNSQHHRQVGNDLEVVRVGTKDEFKNASSNNSSFERLEVEKAAHLMSKSFESEKFRGFQKDELKKPVTNNSSFGGFDVKRASHLTSKSVESKEVKGFQKHEFKKSSFEGFEVKKAPHLMSSKSLGSEKMKGFKFQKDEITSPLSKKSSFKGFDVKRASHLMSKSLESEKMKGFQKDETKNPLSKNSSFKGCEVKRVPQLMSRSLENEEVKGFEQGFEVIRRPMCNRGRRESFCNSEVELGDFFSCRGVKVVAVDMPPLMQIHAVDFARKAHDSLEKFTSKSLASTLKKEFDGAYGPAWHCIVGTSFGSFVTHSVGGFIYFSMDHKLYILLFKTTVKRQE